MILGWVFGVKLSDEGIAEIKCLRVVAMATNYWTKIAISRFLRTNAAGFTAIGVGNACGFLLNLC